MPELNPRVRNGSYPANCTRASESSAASGDNRALKVLMGEGTPPKFVLVATQCLRLGPDARISAENALILLEAPTPGELAAAPPLPEREPAGAAAASSPRPAAPATKLRRHRKGSLRQSIAKAIWRRRTGKQKMVAGVADDAEPLDDEEARQFLSGRGRPCECANQCGSKGHYSYRLQPCKHPAVYQCTGRSSRWLCEHCVCRICKASPARGHGTRYGCKPAVVKEGAAGRTTAGLKRKPAAAQSSRAWPAQLQIARQAQDLLPKLWACDLQCYLPPANHVPSRSTCSPCS